MWQEYAFDISTFFLVLGWCFILAGRSRLFDRFKRYLGHAYLVLFPLTFTLWLGLTYLYLVRFFGFKLNQ